MLDIPFSKQKLFSMMRASIVCAGVGALSPFAYAQTSGEESSSEAQQNAVEQKADQAGAPPLEEFVVVGTRQSLETARDVKRAASNIIDSVTAVDVGALPDKSVAEALQRVPGITVSRFSAPGDTQHFSAEPSGVLVRGLDQVRSEFNGRDTFSADSSRGLSWEDITPELMQRIDVYKNQSADLIEGGIAGVVDLHTRVPFDLDENTLAASAEMNYSAVSESYDPNVSALYSTRWDTGLGEFGILGQLATSRLDTRSEGIYLGRMGLHAPGYFEVANPDGSGTAPTTEETYVPTFITARDNLYERERTGGAFAAQWRSTDESLLTTFQFNRSEYDQVNTEYSSLNWVFALWGQPADHIIQPGWVDGVASLPGQNFTFNGYRSFESGELTAGPGWWGADVMEAAANGVNAEGIPLVNPNGCGTETSPEYTERYCDEPYDRRAVGMETNSRQIISSSMTQDASINLKWSVTDRFRTNFDVQFVDADKDSYGTAGALQSYTGMYADFSGSLPNIEYREPRNVNFSEGGLANPNSWNYAWIQDHKGRSEGESLALRADGEYDLELDWLESIRFGVRTVERKQTVRDAWNFRGITSRWESPAYYNADKTQPIDNVTNLGEETFFAGYPDPELALTRRAFPDSYMGGGVMDNTELLYINPEVLGNPDQVNQYFDRRQLGIGEFYPICSAAGNVRGDELLDSNGNSTCFTPGETLRVEENVEAAYFMVNFGGPNATLFNTDIAVSGNVGVRYVETNAKSVGAVSYGNFTADQLDCYMHTTPENPDDSYVPPSTPYSAGCYLIGAEAHNAAVPEMPDTVDDGNGNQIDNQSKFYLPEHIVGSREDLAFHDGNISEVVGERNYYNLLPSANLKLDVTDNMVVRLAYSKAMARPDFGMYRYAAQLGEPGIDVSYSAQCKNYNSANGEVENLPDCTPSPELTYDEQNRLTGARPRYSANTGNPFIEPITADNYDVSFEYYFEGAGLVTLNVFQKDFENYITTGNVVQQVTNNGVTRDLYVTRPVNGDGASVWGYEINTQRFLDFLPSPWDGIGFQANYTKVYNQGVENPSTDVSSERYVKTDALQGMSEDAYNVVLMYEKGPFAFRTAYNWRSEYLVTANDCCNLPVWQGDQGFLDASIRYRINDMLEVNFQASNLLDTTTNLLQQVRGSDDPDYPNHKVPTAWFKSDQRFSLGLRVKY